MITRKETAQSTEAPMSYLDVELSGLEKLARDMAEEMPFTGTECMKHDCANCPALLICIPC